MNLTRLLLRLALGRRLPITSGELRIRGPRAAITIRRDEHGVAHIEAQNDHDALYAMGFCQGQDRAAQLEVLWRVGRGRLSEWVGKAGLGADRMSRRIGFRRAAEQQVASIDGWVREQMAAFAAGITAGTTTGLAKKPHEFALTGGEPSAWDVMDVLSLLKLQSFLLPSNWDVEVARLRILLADGLDALLALDPAHNDALSGEVSPSVSPFTSSSVLNQLAADLAALQAYLPRGGGSNNWVIHGSRTQSGKPLLASDPHLAPSAPPPWYLLHVRTPEWGVAGAFLAGTAGVAIGHNGFCAWGITAGLTDNADLFIETLGPDGKSVRQADGSLGSCEVLRETIHVKNGPDVVEEVLVTPRGPVVSPLFAGVPVALSIRAVWLDPLPVTGFVGLPRVRSFEEFRRVQSEWPFLPLNVLYADIEGKTGYQLIGTLPRRKSGTGLVPRPADRADCGWDGYVPFAEMPFIEDPGPGYFSTANNPVPGQLELGADYCDDYRHRAVTEALALGEKWSVEQCLALQLDVRCIAWEEVRDIVLGLPPKSVEASDGLELLRAWDGRLDSESPAACVFELFIAQMCQRVARAKAPREWLTVLGENGLGGSGHTLFTDRRVGHLVRLIRSRPDGWFASWTDEMASVLGEVVRKLRRDVGPAPAYWAWGHLRQLRLEHPLFGKHHRLAAAFNLGPVPCGGDCNTVNQAGARPADPTDFTHNMCNMRTVFDLADLGTSRFVLCGGQSGNPWSAHHADQLPLWREGESIVIPWEQADVIRAAKETLRLLPTGNVSGAA